MSKIFCKELNKHFDDKKELFKELVDNMDTIIAAKKATIKFADGIGYSYSLVDNAGAVIKAYGQTNKSEIPMDAKELNVIAVINTTNWLDSHGDCHQDGCWTKTAKENKSIMHLQEHECKFDKIISDGADLKASVVKYAWKDLGVELLGYTEALQFNSNVKKSRNPFMFDQYKDGHVKNHSVGMVYVKISACIQTSDPEFSIYNDNWEKYYPTIANIKDFPNLTYFWAVTEAKAFEGSAVPIGSNTATPTQEVSAKNNDNEAADSTSKTITTEPPQGTQMEVPKPKMDYKAMAQSIKNNLKNN
jgi:hypothetical protein